MSRPEDVLLTLFVGIYPQTEHLFPAFSIYSKTTSVQAVYDMTEKN